ncbi:MAG TPA: glycoside hydrolase family 2 TIM barrel-domain containing protein [Phycisphaerae bacterium]|nr:glycoside hydrolase family 2 TIM barrel-domain containing protein [Phycisphaerae bacterium]HRT43381.1 glycoside hydrolase family 2 TIM barrel-domain containing protein [Phycisphaerae bacterium]
MDGNTSSRKQIGYPRPQLRRANWTPLNGRWDFALDRDARWSEPRQVRWDKTIVVPFAPETTASGIGEEGFFHACWYRRQFERPLLQPGERLILHFGAVDFAAQVWVNGCMAVRHEGGYTPFSADITDLLVDGPAQTLVVRAEDIPNDLTQPRGKQDWQLNPHSIWYPRTTGIWQTVWLEVVPETSIGFLRWTPSLQHWALGVEVRLAGVPRDDLRVRIELEADGKLLSRDTYAVISGEVHRGIVLSDPGIDDYRNELLWSPSHPTLIEARLELIDGRGEIVDDVYSYTALRSIGVQGNRFVLNGRPLLLRMVLDQGYWPDTGLTPPDDAAVRRDVELIKAMGFNGARCHQRVADPRYLYWADRLGLLVWGEMPSAYRFSKRSIMRVTREWTEVVERDVSHPCIVAWVPLNESWGVPDLPDTPAQRHYVQALYHLTKTIDPTRPVIGNDGWESVATDIIGIHDYDSKPRRMVERYGGPDFSIARLAEQERPQGRILVLEPESHLKKPLMLTEFGGIALSNSGDAKSWGYSEARDADELADRYAMLLAAVRSLHLIAGFCYTQFTDTYQEANGLLYADRTPKFPIEEIALITAGEIPDATGGETKWRERLMQAQAKLSDEDQRIG